MRRDRASTADANLPARGSRKSDTAGRYRSTNVVPDATENDSRYTGKSYETITSDVREILPVRSYLIGDFCQLAISSDLWSEFIVGLERHR